MRVRGDFDWNEVPDSRNCTLFHELRFEAYRRVAYARQHWSYNEWHKHIYQLADYLNDFSNKDLSKSHPLKPNELSSITKSVSRWTWDKYYPNHNRGITGLWNLPFSNLTIKLAQQEGARYTHRTRNEKTRLKIKTAISDLRQLGDRPTQVNIAKQSGLARQTVARHKDLLKC
ncbi:primase C-terminal domain-containing protein [Alteromonas halophila]|uniref:primase C-terminal domain-containing protein n=1 Tax=Alteromonas halophila TaxID=516698 RepID=UPI0016754D1A